MPRSAKPASDNPFTVLADYGAQAPAAQPASTEAAAPWDEHGAADGDLLLQAQQGSLHSAHWYRVAKLTPALAPHVRVMRQWVRGEAWYVLENRANGTQFRVNDAAWRVLGLLNGQCSVDRAWNLVLGMLGDDAPTQDEVIQMLGQMHEQDLLKTERPEHAADLDRRGRQRQQARQRQRMNPLATRIKLMDPDRALQACMPLARLLFSPLGAVAVLAVLIVSGSQAISEWPRLVAYGSEHALTETFMLVSFLVFPLLKALHELGHGLAVKRWGGEVHEAGLTLMILSPVPFVDASASGMFPGRWQRIAVSAAGILVELVLAGIALMVWLELQDGMLRQACFAVMLIGGASTLFFNGNPLLRYDGYYVLVDLVDAPNLAQRANKYLLYLLQHYVLGIQIAVSPAAGARSRQGGLADEHDEDLASEADLRRGRTQTQRRVGASAGTSSAGNDDRMLLAGYGLAAMVYRYVLSVGICVWLIDVSGLLALAVGAWLVFSMLVKPLWTGLKAIPELMRRADPQSRPRLVRGLLMLAVLMSLVAVPAPLRTVAVGVVWLPEHARLRAESDGFITAVDVRDGDVITKEQPVATMQDPQLAVQKVALESKLTGLEFQRQSALNRDPVRAQVHAADMERVQAELALLERKIGGLVVRSGAQGRVVLHRPDDLIGRYVKRGEAIGHVLTPGDVVVRVAVRQQDVGLIRERVEAVAARLVTEPGEPRPARMLREVPASSNLLPSAALGDRGGGDFPVDPKDEDGTKALQASFQFDIAVPGVNLTRAGERVWVRLDHGWEPLVMQGVRQLRQMFLKPMQV